MGSPVTVEWFIWHECMNYVGTQDDMCDLVRWVSRSLRQTRLLWLTYEAVYVKCVIPMEVVNKTMYLLMLSVSKAQVSWHLYFGQNN